MLASCCPECGQTLPDRHPFGVSFRGIRARILDRLIRAGQHGIRADLLFDYLYEDDPNGGPDSGMKIIAVHVNQMNKQLKPKGKEIRGGRTGHGVFANYVLRDVP